MKFTLHYRGKLPSNGNPAEKHAIREKFHLQLSQLWSQPPLDRIAQYVVEVSQGTKWYVTKDFVGEVRTPVDHSYDTYVGHFENNGPEGPAARIFVRNGRLMASLFAEESPPRELSPTGKDGTFRFVEPAYSPEYLHFDSVIDGHALRLDMTGVSLYRKDSP